MKSRLHLLSERGFTLIELLVVIVILAILMAVAAPSFLGQTQKAQDSAAEQSLSVTYKAAKALSVDNPTQGSYASVDAAKLGDVEPELSFTDSSDDPDNTGIINVSLSGDDLVLKMLSGSGKVCTLSAPMNGVQTIVCARPLPAPPVNIGPPVISGNFGDGHTLSTSNGSWTGNPTSFSYQWQERVSSVWTNLPSATGASYTIHCPTACYTSPPDGDNADAVRVIVTAHNAGGATPVTAAKSYND